MPSDHSSTVSTEHFARTETVMGRRKLRRRPDYGHSEGAPGRGDGGRCLPQVQHQRADLLSVAIPAVRKRRSLRQKGESTGGRKPKAQEAFGRSSSLSAATLSEMQWRRHRRAKLTSRREGCWPLNPIRNYVANATNVKCSPILGQRELEFSGVLAQFGGGADEPFISEIGTLLPMALCGRTSL